MGRQLRNRPAVRALGWARILGLAALLGTFGAPAAAEEPRPGVVTRDVHVRVEKTQRTIPSDDAERQFQNGRNYVLGRGVEKDLENAIRWFRLAAGQGHPNAMAQLGVSYQKGRGVAADQAQAIEWFRKAADLGNARGMLELAHAYRSGDGVEKDPVVAMKWYVLSSERGGIVAKLVGRSHRRELTQEQREAAAKLIAEWRAEHEPAATPEQTELAEGAGTESPAEPEAAAESPPEPAPEDPPGA